MVLADSLHRYSLIFAGTLISFYQDRQEDGKKGCKAKRKIGIGVGLFFKVGNRKAD